MSSRSSTWPSSSSCIPVRRANAAMRRFSRNFLSGFIIGGLLVPFDDLLPRGAAKLVGRNRPTLAPIEEAPDLVNDSPIGHDHGLRCRSARRWGPCRAALPNLRLDLVDAADEGAQLGLLAFRGGVHDDVCIALSAAPRGAVGTIATCGAQEFLDCLELLRMLVVRGNL